MNCIAVPHMRIGSQLIAFPAYNLIHIKLTWCKRKFNTGYDPALPRTSRPSTATVAYSLYSPTPSLYSRTGTRTIYRL